MSEMPMLACGHQANATSNGVPSCAICCETRVAAEQPDLSGRIARCIYRDCKSARPSTDSLTGALAFFEFNGTGSRRSLETCKHCKYYAVAHEKPRHERARSVCGKFEPIGDTQDTYYCGCKGWN